jgi:deoxycytidylate deaminase
LSSRNKFELICTSFDKRGNIIATRSNQYTKSNPWQKELSVKAGLSELRIYLHAEVACLLASRTKKVHSLLVQRFNKNGTTANACPCLSCKLAVIETGVKYVRYTTDCGIVQVNPKDWSI